MVVIHRNFQLNLVGLAATSAVITAVIGLAAKETLKKSVRWNLSKLTPHIRKATGLTLASLADWQHPCA